MQQVIFIHGGTTFRSYENYINHLETKPVYKTRLTSKQMWFNRLQDELGSDYEVLLPSMPNKTNAQYHEWTLWFSRIAEIAEDNCILVGHSMGGIFLPKYLSEYTFPKKIRATVLVAAPYDDETGEDLTDFKIDNNLSKFAQQAGEIVFYHGQDDATVPLSELEKYTKLLDKAETHILPAQDHFMRENFPEIIARIKALTS